MEKIIETRRPSIHWITAFVAVVLFATSTIGLLSVWLLQNQLDQQAWAQVEQGQRAAIALHSAQYREILNLATLTAQRPTLQKLLIEKDVPMLKDYLHALKSSAGLTRIIICDPQDQIIATTDETVPEIICQKWRTGNYQYNPNIPQACLTAHQSIEDENGILGEVFVCNQLDDTFATQISEETGLEHTLWIGDVPVSTSFDVGASELANCCHTIHLQDGRTSRHTFEVNGRPYYAAHLPLEEAGLSAEVALDVTEIQITRNWLARTLVVSVLGVTLISSVLGVSFFLYINRL